MKWYSVQFITSNSRRALECDTAHLLGYRPVDFKMGLHIEGWEQGAWFRNQDLPEMDGPPDDMLITSFWLPVFSQRMQETLISAGVRDIQYLPVDVIHHGGQRVVGYAIANVLGLLDAFDHVRSIYTVYDEKFPIPKLRGLINWSSQPVLIGAMIENRDIIRLKIYPSPIWVSDRFVKAFKKAKLRGGKFVEIGVS